MNLIQRDKTRDDEKYEVLVEMLQSDLSAVELRKVSSSLARIAKRNWPLKFQGLFPMISSKLGYIVNGYDLGLLILESVLETFLEKTILYSRHNDQIKSNLRDIAEQVFETILQILQAPQTPQSSIEKPKHINQCFTILTIISTNFRVMVNESIFNLAFGFFQSGYESPMSFINEQTMMHSMQTIEYIFDRLCLCTQFDLSEECFEIFMLTFITLQQRLAQKFPFGKFFRLVHSLDSAQKSIAFEHIEDFDLLQLCDEIIPLFDYLAHQQVSFKLLVRIFNLNPEFFETRLEGDLLVRVVSESGECTNLHLISEMVKSFDFSCRDPERVSDFLKLISVYHQYSPENINFCFQLISSATNLKLIEQSFAFLTHFNEYDSSQTFQELKSFSQSPVSLVGQERLSFLVTRYNLLQEKVLWPPFGVSGFLDAIKDQPLAIKQACLDSMPQLNYSDKLKAIECFGSKFPNLDQIVQEICSERPLKFLVILRSIFTENIRNQSTIQTVYNFASLYIPSSRDALDFVRLISLLSKNYKKQFDARLIPLLESLHTNIQIQKEILKILKRFPSLVDQENLIKRVLQSPELVDPIMEVFYEIASMNFSQFYSNYKISSAPTDFPSFSMLMQDFLSQFI